MKRDKYIVISREGGDWSMDLIFAGLVRKFGKENVIDYPARDKFRQGPPQLVGDDEKDYGAERRSLGYVEGCEDMKCWTRREIMESWGQIHTVFMDETDESYEKWMELFQIYSGPTPTVIIAGHDSFRGDVKNVRDRLHVQFRHMFIDDWKSEYDSYDQTSLINLSCNFDHLWDCSRELDLEYDLCFYGYNSHPQRKLVMDHVKKKWGHLNNAIVFEERPDTFDRFIRHDELYKTMAQSKICLNIRGASTGGRALRYYEIPYVGSFMLSAPFEAKLLHGFEDGVHCSYFHSLEQLDTQIEFFLSDEGEVVREKMALSGHKHCMEHHTVDARINYIIGVLDGQEATLRQTR